MLGKASEIHFESFDCFYGAFVTSDPMHKKLERWKDSNPNAIIVEIQYRTYSATDADGNGGWGETALIIYKEETTHENI